MKCGSIACILICLLWLAAGCDRDAEPDETAAFDPGLDGPPGTIELIADSALMADQKKIVAPEAEFPALGGASSSPPTTGPAGAGSALPGGATP